MTQNGNESADEPHMDSIEFENIAARLRAKSLQISRMMGLSADDADDVAQDVLLKIWLIRHDLAPERSIDAIVAVATRHRAIDMFRQSKRTSAIDDVDISSVSDQFTPLNDLEYAETDKWLQEKIRSLPDSERTVLMMRQVQKREYSEIAAVIGIEETSARVLLSRARKKLLQQFKDYAK